MRALMRYLSQLGIGVSAGEHADAADKAAGEVAGRRTLDVRVLAADPRSLAGVDVPFRFKAGGGDRVA
jgi:hypothetical protein